MEGGEGGEGREGRGGRGGVRGGGGRGVLFQIDSNLAFYVVVGKLPRRKEQNDASFSFIAPSSEE